ncbi:MAG: isoprenylcysteine carboxylmethyltransferase family protein [Ignavibacteriaceae bacterium]|nr:isoprenylcysteine carboxylmethyltransferase family protein [Ignavibacteriaceae bacterium]
MLSILFILILFALFAVVHTWLASDSLKFKIKNRFPRLLPYYRLMYNFLAIITFLIFYFFSPKPDVIIFDLHYPFDMLILFPQFIGIAGLVWTLFHIDGKEFMGISQVMRLRNNSYDYSTLDEESHLRISGPYKISRHPIYFFSIIFLLFRPYMTLFYAISIFCFIVYFYIGSIFEERKLVARFGNSYIKYQNEVGRIIPSFKIFLNQNESKDEINI